MNQFQYWNKKRVYLLLYNNIMSKMSLFLFSRLKLKMVIWNSNQTY